MLPPFCFGVMFGLTFWWILLSYPSDCLPLQPSSALNQGVSKSTRQLHPASGSHARAAPDWQKREQPEDEKFMLPADQMTDNMIDQQLADMEAVVKDEFSDDGFGMKGPSKFETPFGQETGSPPRQSDWKRFRPHSHSRRGTDKKCKVNKAKKASTSSAGAKNHSRQQDDEGDQTDEGLRKQTISGGSEPVEKFAQEHYLNDASREDDTFKPVLPIVILKDDGGGSGSKHKTQVLPAIEVIESD